VYAIINE
jgi:hypothetical protein